MKEWDILSCQKIHWAFLRTSRGQNSPRSTPLVSHPSCRRSILERTAYEPWSMRLVNDGSPAPTFWSFVLGHDKLSPVEQQRHWLEDSVCLELIRHKDGSIVVGMHNTCTIFHHNPLMFLQNPLSLQKKIVKPQLQQLQIVNKNLLV